jgi:Tfp pilus assembly protein PilF
MEVGQGLPKRAVEINSNGSKGHLFLSIAIGRVALDAGAKERVKLSKEVKSEVDKALAIDTQDDAAWHVLGRWHRRLSSLSWIEKIKRAIQLNPSHINHHLELAITYEKMGRKDLAAAEYNQVLELPVKDADDEDHKKEAEERLKKMG